MNVERMILLIGMLMLSSCKASEPIAASTIPVNTNVRTCVLVIQLKDNNGTMSQVMATIQQIILPLHIKVTETFTLFSDTKVVQVMANSVSDERIELLRSALFKIDGLLQMKIYSNEKIAAEQLAEF